MLDIELTELERDRAPRSFRRDTVIASKLANRKI